MSNATPATRTQTLCIGALAVAGGAYLLAVGAGLLPVPGGPRNLHAPLAVVAGIGIAVLLAGVAALLQSLAKADDTGELPAGAPMAVRIALYIIGVALFAAFAMIASWVAFGGGPRAFSGSFGGLSGGVGEGVGRAAFGIGAVIIWLATAAVAVTGWRKLMRSR